MDILWIVIGIILLLIGFIGAFVPGISGTIVSFLALLVLQLKKDAPFTEEELVIFGLIAAGVTFLDYLVPIWGTKKFGGTKMGVRGSTIGLIFAIVVLPILGIVIGPFGLLGIILGPFIGAYIGETISGQDSRVAMRSAIGSFIGFLAGTLMKVVYSIVVSYYFFDALF